MPDDPSSKELQLFYTPDTCSLASLIACFEAGLDPEVIRISFAAEEQKSARYLAINPKGRVPALKAGDTIITETPAILAYIAQIAPEADLAPKDPLGFAMVQEFNSYLCSTLHVAHAHRMRGYRWVDGEDHEAAMRAKVPATVGACYAYIDEHVFRGPFVFGGAFSLSDAYLFTIAQWMESDGVDPDDFPRLRDHRTLIAAREAVQKALSFERP